MIDLVADLGEVGPAGPAGVGDPLVDLPVAVLVRPVAHFVGRRFAVADGPAQRGVAALLADGALAPWRKGKSPYFLQTIEAIAKHYEFDRNARWKDLPKHVQQVFLYGSGDEEIGFRYDEGGRVYQVTRVFEGVIPNMERRYRETDSNWIREEFERYQNNRPCGACGGLLKNVS